MSDSLPLLEKERSALAQQISQLGDFRSGSITGTQGRCGNPNCHCHKPGDAGHGPNPRLTYKVKGKTVTESFPTPAVQRKAAREIAEFRKFQQLNRSFVEVNEKICRSRPVEETLTTEGKKRRTRSSRKSLKK